MNISEEAILAVIDWGQRRLLETTDPDERAQIEAQIQDKLDLLSGRLSFRVRFTAVAPEQVAIARVEQAAMARDVKAEKEDSTPEKSALIAAIDAEQGDRPLAADGFAVVDVWKIARILKRRLRA